MAGRVGESMPVGNEGAGIVVKAGDSPKARSAARQDRRHARRRDVLRSTAACRRRSACVLPEGTTPAEGASCFVNPLTALGMVETMRAEGHTALVHTAAASNLGQMLNEICLADGVALVNIVRKPEQVGAAASRIGANHVCNSESPDLHGGPDRRAGRHRRHPRLRRHRRRASRRPDPHRHGSGRQRRPRRSTAATARRCTSRSTSTAASIAARPRSSATSAWPGASAAGCSRRSCRRSATPRRRSCASASRAS